MTATVFVNGNWCAEDDARISVFDRGFLFADAVYEVTAVLDGRLIDFDAHYRRLARSTSELRIPLLLDRDDCLAMHRELVQRNALTEGIAYLQISRGAAPRDFAYPQAPTPTVVAFTQVKALRDTAAAQEGIRVVTQPDIRWKRCDIKTVGLLGASMTKQCALDAGADDAWFVDAAGVTEGTSNNAYIVTPDKALITRALGNEILAGITRDAILEVAAEQKLTLVERPFSVAEAHTASEAFISSATTFVLPVVAVDGHRLGTGVPGPVTRALRQRYLQRALESAI